MIRAIAALDTHNGIATESGIPWDLPGDRAYFKEQTWNRDVLMGFNTYKELASPLAGRQNYVWVRSNAPLREGFSAVNDINEFLYNHPETWIIGGEGLFRQTLSHVDEIYITRVEGDFKCTKFFPEFEQGFNLVRQSDKKIDKGISYSYQVWKRKKT